MYFRRNRGLVQLLAPEPHLGLSQVGQLRQFLQRVPFREFTV